MENSVHHERRREALDRMLLGMLNEYASGEFPDGSYESWLAQVTNFVEKEVASAFGRGRNPLPERHPSQDGSQRFGKPSAVQAGKMRPAKRVPKHPAQ